MDYNDNNTNNINNQMMQQPQMYSPVYPTQKQNSSKGWFILIGVLVGIFLIFTIIAVIFINSQHNGGNTVIEKTALMSLYEQLDEKMTYGDLKAKMEEVVPGASIVNDEGAYVIKIASDDGGGGSTISEYITCGVEMEDANQVNEGLSNDEAGEDINNVDVDTSVEGGSEGDEEDDEESTEEIDLYAGLPTAESSTIMTHFVYSIYGEVNSNDGSNAYTTEMFIRPDEGGYMLYNGAEYLLYTTKADAVKELLYTLNK